MPEQNETMTPLEAKCAWIEKGWQAGAAAPVKLLQTIAERQLFDLPHVEFSITNDRFGSVIYLLRILWVNDESEFEVIFDMNTGSVDWILSTNNEDDFTIDVTTDGMSEETLQRVIDAVLRAHDKT